MNNKAIYAYDTRTQMQKPVFIVYNEDHVELVKRAIYGLNSDTSFLLLTPVRMHAYEQADPFATKWTKKQR